MTWANGSDAGGRALHSTQSHSSSGRRQRYCTRDPLRVSQQLLRMATAILTQGLTAPQASDSDTVPETHSGTHTSSGRQQQYSLRVSQLLRLATAILYLRPTQGLTAPQDGDSDTVPETHSGFHTSSGHIPLTATQRYR